MLKNNKNNIRTYSSNTETDKVTLSACIIGFDILWRRIIHGKFHKKFEITPGNIKD
jgi:hypothetical protein